MVLEARGLDVTPTMIARAESSGDLATARILSRIFNDEIRHVAAGTKWFAAACAERGFAAPAHWRTLVKARFRGALKPPFNDSARAAAGLTQEFYQIVAS
jgi:uncharacterized ferritin-like protein (DUF455 family)